VSLKKSSKGLDENMKAAKSNFLFRGYFKKEEKAAQKTKDSVTEKKAEEQKANDKMKR
jgi:phospholipid/cholesterol/gamma-HCH transport system substrate-binding protein